MRSLILIQVLFLIATGGMAQTPDRQTPAEEDICGGLEGQAFGLCNAYCEAMDCDSDAPNASAKACVRIRDRFLLATGGDELPCVVRCPCAYELDFSQWADQDEVEVFCGVNTTAGAGSVAGPFAPLVIANFDPREGGILSCRTIDAAGSPIEVHEMLTEAELHACSLDVLAYLQALRAARGDLTFVGDDLDTCEPIP